MSDQIAPALHVRDLHRTYSARGKESVHAVRGVNLSVDPGQVVAVLGPNGAGKTTTVRICATLLTPTSGVVEINGYDVLRETSLARRELGLVLGGDKGFYDRATARDNLGYFAELAMVPRRQRRPRVESLLERVGLSERAGSRVETFSRGMKQRLHIARALLGDPAVVLLDEPTMGLDPEASLSMRSLIRELADAGKAVLLTTHNLHEAQAIAHEINVIAEGRVLVSGSVEDVAQAAGAGWVTSAIIDAPPQACLDELHGIEGVVAVESEGRDRVTVTVFWRDDRVDEPAVERCLATVHPRSMVSRPANLEEAYLALLASMRTQSEATSLALVSSGAEVDT